MSLILLRSARSTGRSFLIASASARVPAPTSRKISRGFAFNIKSILPNRGSSSSGGGGGGGPPVITAIITMNAVIFGCWNYATSWEESVDQRRARSFLTTHFTISYTNVFINHHYFSLCNYMFSHTNTINLVLDMLLIYFMRPTAQVLGGGAFARLYFIGGISGGLFHIFSPFFIPDEWPSGGSTNRYIKLATPGVGATGAIAGVWIFEALLYRQQQSMLLTACLAAFDLYYLYNGNLARGNGIFLGGSVGGAAWYLLQRRRGRL